MAVCHASFTIQSDRRPPFHDVTPAVQNALPAPKVPVVDGAMQLGEFGRIYFADFDQVRARERTVRVQIVGE